MPTSLSRALATTGVVAAVALASVAAFGAADDPAPKSVAGIKDVMLAVNEGDGSVVGMLRADLKNEKLDDEAWEVAHGRAAMIAEAGNVLLGLKPPAGAGDAAGLSKWKKHVGAYRDCAEQIVDATSKKDVAAAKAAMQSLAKRCADCHKDHRAD